MSKKYYIFLYLLVICAIIILGIVNKRSIEDIGGCLITVFIMIGVFIFFDKIMS